MSAPWPKWKRQLVGLAWSVLVVVVLASALPSCGGVYEEVAPPEKRRVLLKLKPDFIRIGETEKQISAFVEVAPEGTFVTDIDMSADIEVMAYDTRGNKGCDGISDPPEFAGRDLFRLCLTVALLDGARVGERRISVEVRAAGEPVLGEFQFFVLNAPE